MSLTLVLRQPEAAERISKRLLAGTYDASQTKDADLAASPADVAAVEAFATSHHLKIVKTDAIARTIRVSGSAAEIEAAFQVKITANYRGPFHMPSPVDQIVIAVLGLDDTPIARAHA